jgi:hypothetical protein
VNVRGVFLTIIAVLLGAAPALAGTNYVDITCTNPIPPYTDWTTAATNIQDAVDATTDGDIVLVTNGVYDTGARVTPGHNLSNRVVITKNILVQSVNGPAVTIIKGQGPMGKGAIRCVFMNNGTLEGFTLTNGFTGYMSWDMVHDQSGAGLCALSGTVNNCTISGNSGAYVGGVEGGTLNNCTISGNSGCSYWYDTHGGGAEGSTLNNCIISGNSSDRGGGGAIHCTLNNCIVTGNSADFAGGAIVSTLNNCTVTGNSALSSGGGVCLSTLNNCIVYYNISPDSPEYAPQNTFNYCCTTPDPGGVGNITNEPVFISSDYHIAVSSPCVGAGSSAYASGIDMDGDSRKNPPSIGCDEPTVGTLTGTISVVFLPQAITAATGLAFCFTPQISGRCTSNVWNFGDGSMLNNAIYARHAWETPGDYALVMTAFNESYSDGVEATVTIHVVSAEATARYVWTNSPAPAWPYDSWSSAAHTIQEAVDAQTLYGGWVCVTDGVYETGAQITPGHIASNRVVITNSSVVKSVNGPAVTIIKGQGPLGATAIRCVFITNGVLDGFTLTNGFAGGNIGDEFYDRSGGGAYAVGSELKNCVLNGNSAERKGGAVEGGTLWQCTINGNWAGLQGGGAYGSTLWQCTINGNSATHYCGGAYGGTLNNCIVTGNSADYGGGTCGGILNNCTLSRNSAGAEGGGADCGTLNNCIVYYNTAPTSNNTYCSTASYCCTPDPGGVGNITNAPMFVDTNAGNYRLQAGSPCVNAGDNASVQGAFDLDGNPRIQNGVVDMGAYESTMALSVALPPSATEGDAPVTGRVSISVALLTNLTVSLVSSDTSEVTVTNEVVLPAGQTSVTFSVAIVDDALMDGSQAATVTASAVDFADGSAGITVYDNDVHHFDLTSISSPQTPSVPFSVTITAKDINGVTLTAYVSSVQLSAAGDSGSVPIEPTNTTAFAAGAWSGSVTALGVGSNVRLTATDNASGSTGQSDLFEIRGALISVVPNALTNIQVVVTGSCVRTLMITNLGNEDLTFATTIDSSVSTNGIVLYYTFGTNENGIVPDLSGNANSGTVYGATCTPGGIRDGAYGFDAVDDYISVPNSTSLGLTSVTISAWVYVTDKTGDDMDVAEKGPHLGGWEFQIWRGGYTGLNYLLLRGVGAAGVIATCTISTGAWHHVAGTIAGTSGKIYIDGILNNAGVVAPVPITSYPLYIGNSFSPNAFFGGKIDDVQIYNRVLSSNEVHALYENPESGGLPDWLSVQAGSGIVPPGGSTNITVTFDATGCVTGQHNGAMIAITCNDAVNPGITVPVSMDVVPPSTAYWLDLSVSGPGSLDLASGWFDIGSSPVVTATPSYGYHLVAWTGDTNGCGINGNQITIPVDVPRSIGATFAINTYDITATNGPNGTIDPAGTVWVVHGGSTDFNFTPDANYHTTNVMLDGVAIGPMNDYTFANVTNGGHTITALFGIDEYTLTVASPCGTPIPSGVTTNPWSSLINASIASPVANGSTTQYLCRGWEMTGNGPFSGTTNSFAMTQTNNAALTWLWMTNYWLQSAAGSGGSVDVGDQWLAGDSTIVITATPTAVSYFSGWTGDVPPANTNDNPLTLTMDHTRAVTANFIVTTHYVSPAGSNVAPYASWDNAAQDIQSAVDIASDGDTVLVTNGVYDTGARVTPGHSLSNRVVITKNILVKSVNGPAVTIIKGQGPMGRGAIRCVFINAGVLDGFTLTNGFTFAISDGGDARYDWGGGGASALYANLQNCILSGNSATFGGGVDSGTLTDCTIIGNSASSDGGGAYGSTLNNCTIIGNSAVHGGGGVSEGPGMDADEGTLTNCLITGNSAGVYGGGTYRGTLNNCTVNGNSAGVYAGGTDLSALKNCIIYHNNAPTEPNYHNFFYSIYPAPSYCCTTPDPGGTGNITNEPMFVSLGHIAVNSPCVGAGSSTYAAGTDLDGDPWQNPPSIGCDEPSSGSLTGSMAVAIQPATLVSATNVVVQFAAQIEGRCASNLWNFGDGSTAPNVIYASHSWTAVGDYAVVLTAFNESYVDGVAATVTIHVVSAEATPRYVWTNSPAPAWPYDSWSSAAHTIQEAVDAQTLFGGWVCVTDGVYDVGGCATPGHILSNRVVITNSLLVKSVNGPAVTIIKGQGPLGSNAVRCVFMNSGILDGFTLTNGFTLTDEGNIAYDMSGGGAYASGGTLSNCTITGNSATFDAGGVCGGTLNDCTIIGNSARCSESYHDCWGGGTFGGTLHNCNIIGNTANALVGQNGEAEGGGAYGSTLDNCTVISNTASAGMYANGGGVYDGILNNCDLIGNSAGGCDQPAGGGAYKGTLNNCTLRGNSALGLGGGGGGAYNANLNNCTIINNSADTCGGVGGDGNPSGLFSEYWDWNTLNNCTISSNSASEGGGASGLILNNCILSGNLAMWDCGGAGFCILANCTITGNSASNSGGGAYQSVLTNCIVYYNTAPTSNNMYCSTASYCCITPDPGGTGNITNAPMFVDTNAGNYRLQAGSPCINAGNNASVQGALDLDGNPRIVFGTVDMGAYEFNQKMVLTINSEHGSSTPAAAVYTNDYLAELTNAVTSEVLNGTTQYLCSGWAMTGNDPASGTTNSFVMTQTNNATLTWLWQTNYWLNTEAGPHGSVDLGDDWHGLGSNVVVTAIPDAHYHFAGWSGDTQGDTNALAMTLIMDQPRTVTANFAIDRYTLTVVSAHGGTNPGTITADYNTSLSQFITNSPVADGAGTQYVCMAATVSGNDFTQVSPTNITLTLTNNAALTWLWKTNFWLATASGGGGTVDVVSGWYAAGNNATITASPASHYHFVGWTGDTNSATLSGTNITIAMTQARTIIATFAIDEITLQVNSQWGAPSPAAGIHTNDYGTMITNTVLASDLLGGTQAICLGWTMTGNAPVSGTTNSFAMTQTNSAALDWLWSTNFWLAAHASGSGAVDVTGGWYSVGTNVTVKATSIGNSRFFGWAGDTNGATINGSNITVRMTSAKSITANFGLYLTVQAAGLNGSTQKINIAVTPNDYSNNASGTTPFVRCYGAGSVVGLSAPGTLAGGWKFADWTGVDTQTGTNATVTMLSNMVVRALYDPAPVVVITNPTLSTTYTTTNRILNIRGRASSPVCGIARVEFSSDRSGSGLCTGTTNWIYNGITLYNGANTITVTAYDTYSNAASDTLTVSYASKHAKLQNLALLGGAVVRQINISDNLVPGTTNTIQWQVESFEPVLSGLKIRLPDGSSVTNVTLNGAMVGATNAVAVLGDWQSVVYSFQADWIVPDEPGACRIRFLTARQDGYAYVNANIPDGMDSRPYGPDGKEIARDISGVGTTPAIQNEVLTKASKTFESLAQAGYRRGSVVQNIQMNDNLTPGNVVTCKWSILTYPGVKARMRVDLPVEADVLGAGAKKATSNTWWRLPATGKLVEYNGSLANDSVQKLGTYYGLKQYCYQYVWTVPNDPGTCRVGFDVTLGTLTNWIPAVLPDGVDGRVLGTDGLLIERDIASTGGAPAVLTMGVTNATGNISYKGDADWYQFTVATTGTYRVETYLGTLTDTIMKLYGPDSQTTLLGQNDNAIGLASRIISPLDPGIYYIKITAPLTKTGAYKIIVSP